MGREVRAVMVGLVAYDESATLEEEPSLGSDSGEKEEVKQGAGVLGLAALACSLWRICCSLC